MLIGQRQRGFFVLHSLFQSICLLLGFFLWLLLFKYLFFKNLTISFQGFEIYALVLALTPFVLARFNYLTEIPELLGSDLDRMRLAARQSIVISQILLIFMSVIYDNSTTRYIVFSYLAVIFFIMIAVNLLLPRMMLPLIFGKNSREVCILLNCDLMSHSLCSKEDSTEENEQKIKLILEWLKKQAQYGLYLVGIMGNDNFLAKKIGVHFLGFPSDLADVIQTTKATSLIITGMPERRILSYAIAVCENMAVRLSIIHDLELHFGRPVSFQSIDGINFMRFRPEPLQNPFRSFTKRVLDIIISIGVVTIILPPITLLVWLFQLMQSPGPLFYRQERSGRGNKTFMINKFRSMHVGNYDSSKQATVNDPRIYPFGAFLRRTSLDELPQFLNALIGDMSVVGPRPHIPQHNELWKQAMRSYNLRSLVRPGITGLAQTRGYRGEVKTEEDVARRVECDIEYIEKWSLLLDISLITKTFLQIFRLHN